ncbi:hypothetical protein BIV25_05840 [Streptomyces sp. MUSC 14]|uniref:hypothetical protein n=1 Tax=Streptomyces sp. MUSC 14 TaxID=1354889 RepID=UPI0008F5F030|nr:hypothetical protein [Streptomyces sp. MUSC 14]OIK01332.1 hypothetical protein BIV25_05840 [Streptomyces sp. MUSC 14]
MEKKEIEAVVRTDAGMCGLWQAVKPGASAWYGDDGGDVEDDELAEWIEAGVFVPLNVGGDGTFGVTVRVADAAEAGGLSEREARHRLVSSDPYLLVSQGDAVLGGLEEVGNGGTLLPLPAGRYAVVVHLVDWQSDPASVGPDGSPAEGALPDFAVTISEALAGTAYRKDIETFDPPQ